jgi:putative hemolysin
MQAHSLEPENTSLGGPSMQAGHYEVRLAKSTTEIEAAQALRYRVFYLENNGRASKEMIRLEREVDEWDKCAHHIIVLDHKADNAVVGTLRLVSNNRLAHEQSFYTEKAFDLSKLRANYDRILELSRYCIEPGGRSGTILLLIWKYAMKFIVDNHYQLMLGCASFPGLDVNQHKNNLMYLYQNNLAPEELRPVPIVSNSVDIAALHDETSDVEWDDKQKAVPTLLRGYLKLGARISDTAIIDKQFNTVFVCIYVDAADMLLNNHTLVPKN